MLIPCIELITYYKLVTRKRIVLPYFNTISIYPLAAKICIDVKRNNYSTCIFKSRDRYMTRMHLSTYLYKNSIHVAEL